MMGVLPLMAYARFLPLFALGLAGCAHGMAEVQHTPSAFAVLTGTSRSMTYALETTNGMVLIDLGWVGAEREIAAALQRAGRRPDDVVAALLTHSHRDHVSAWPLLKGSTFFMGAAEVDRFVAAEPHQAWGVRLAESLKQSRLPRQGELRVVGFSQDTALVFGRDTVYAFLVPGHTAGSAAYLVRGILFVGDAVSYSWYSKFRPPRSIYSDDTTLAKRSLAALSARLSPHRVTHMCTAHAECTRFTAELLERLAR